MQDRRKDDNTTVQLIADRINALHGDVGDLRDIMIESMREMTSAVTKLAEVDVRQISLNQSYDRLNAIMDKDRERTERLEARIDELEKQQPMTKQVTSWIMYGVGAAVVAVATFVAKSVGLM